MATAATTTEPTPVTTVTEPRPLLTISPSEVPVLVNEWGAGTGDPLDLARRIIGFPLEIGVPDGSTPMDMSVHGLLGESTTPGSWAWSYAASSVVGAIDPDLLEGGPGTSQLRDFYDPILQSLGWHEAAQVISGRGSGGSGARSVNLAYKPNFDTMSVGGVEATPVVAKVWADEDLDFMPGPDRAGHRVDVDTDIRSDLIPVPFPALLLDRLPVVPGATLREVRFYSSTQLGNSYSPEVFDFREGDRLLELELGLGLPADSTDLAHEKYSTGLDGITYQMGRPSSMAVGAIEMAAADLSDNTWTQPVIVLGRYPGTITVVADPNAEEVGVTVKIRFEPNRVVLAPA